MDQPNYSKTMQANCESAIGRHFVPDDPDCCSLDAAVINYKASSVKPEPNQKGVGAGKIDHRRDENRGHKPPNRVVDNGIGRLGRLQRQPGR
jgi:hypothetical protein